MPKNNRHNEKGMIMFEGMFGIIMCIIVMTMLISLGFFLYQKTVFTIVCNQVAESVVQTYKYKDRSEPSSLSLSDMNNVGRFRYFLFVRDGFQTSNKNKLINGLNERMERTSLAVAKDGTLGTTVDIKSVGDDVGRMHFEVTFQKKYTYLFEHELDMLGLSDITTLKTTVYVQSVDFSNYANTVKLVNYGLKKLSTAGSLTSLLNSAVSLLGNAYKIIT